MNLSVFFCSVSQSTLRLKKSVAAILIWLYFLAALNYSEIIKRGEITVVEPLLSGIVLGLIPITLAGLFVAAYMQYRRGDQLGG